MGREQGKSLSLYSLFIKHSLPPCSGRFEDSLSLEDFLKNRPYATCAKMSFDWRVRSGPETKYKAGRWRGHTGEAVATVDGRPAGWLERTIAQSSSSAGERMPQAYSVRSEMAEPQGPRQQLAASGCGFFYTDVEDLSW